MKQVRIKKKELVGYISVNFYIFSNIKKSLYEGNLYISVSFSRRKSPTCVEMQ